VRTRWWTPLLLATLVPLSGCGAVYAPAASGGVTPAAHGTTTAGDPPSPASASPSSSSAPASSRQPIPAPAQLTMADNNHTITMKVGQTFTLALGDEQWKPTVADQTVLARLPNFAMVRGAQGIYKAYRAGTTTLKATGTPACPAGKACPMFVLLFAVTVQVTA